MNPKVSVIIPVYNVEKLLPRCLDSIVNQTLQDIEIICVNDGSPDRSIDVLNRYAAADSRIRVISQENRGLGGARNTGFEAATGDYILYIDSDDWVDANYCESLYAGATAADADVACASIQKVRPSYAKWVLKIDRKVEVCNPQERFSVCFCPPNFCVVNKLMRRELLVKLGVRFEERVCYEDVKYTMRVLGECQKLVTVPDVTYRYMINNAGITKSRQTPKKQMDKYLAHRAFVEYMDSQGLAVDRRFRNITRRSYDFAGISWLKIKVRDGREVFRLFDLIPIWCHKAR